MDTLRWLLRLIQKEGYQQEQSLMEFLLIIAKATCLFMVIWLPVILLLYTKEGWSLTDSYYPLAVIGNLMR